MRGAGVGQWPIPAQRKERRCARHDRSRHNTHRAVAAEFGSETIDVKGRGAVDLTGYECLDTPRSTLIQRACYDPAQASMIVSVKGAYVEYCDLPRATFDALMAAPSMGQFFRQNFGKAGSVDRHDCGPQQVPGS